MKIPMSLRRCAKSCLLIALAILTGYTGHAQTFVYSFTNGVLKSGTALTNGAIYLFSNVKSGTDAIVKISNITSGVTLSSLDSYSVSTGGYDEAFQPTLNVGAGATINSYVEFTFTFIVSGTYNTTTKTGTLQAQTLLIPATALDIDGNGAGLYEFDELNLGANSIVDYSSTTSQLSVTSSANNVTGKDITGTNYSGINVSNTDVMFTVLNNTQTLTSFVYRTGAISSAAVSGRVASLAFFRPTYPSSVLPLSPLENFSGSVADHTIDLQWQLTASGDLSDLILERSYNNIPFQAVKDYTFTHNSGAGTAAPFQFQGSAPDGDTYYRLKMVSASGDVQYSSTLHFEADEVKTSIFRVYPTLVSNTATISINAEKAGAAILRLSDYAGREFYHQPLSLNKGINTLTLNLPGNLYTGSCIAILQAGGKMYTQKIIIQR